MTELDRITFDPEIMGGRACVRGMRVTVSLLLNMVASGMSEDEIMDAYPYVEREDIRQSSCTRHGSRTTASAAWMRV